jgi:hypothetical protein
MFEHPLTNLDQYWIGFFRADGCISRSGKYKNAQFAQNDLHAVKEFANYIGKSGKVRSVFRSTNFGDCAYHSISSSKIAYLLDELGAKTQLHEPLYQSPHFWRGLMDGDGSIKLDLDRVIIDLNGSIRDLENVSDFL